MKKYYFFKSITVEAENLNEAEAKFKSMLPQNDSTGWMFSHVPKFRTGLEEWFKEMTLQELTEVYKEWEKEEDARIEEECYYD